LWCNGQSLEITALVGIIDGCKDPGTAHGTALGAPRPVIDLVLPFVIPKEGIPVVVDLGMPGETVHMVLLPEPHQTFRIDLVPCDRSDLDQWRCIV